MKKDKSRTGSAIDYEIELLNNLLSSENKST